MATATLQNANLRFPSGTSVAAYPETQRGAGGGGPTGSATETATVAANGTLTFSSLAAGTNYVAYALVDGEHRYMGFSAARSAAQLDPSTNWASDQEVRDAVAAAVADQIGAAVSVEVTSQIGAFAIVIDATQAPYNVQFDNDTDDTDAILAALDDAVVAVPGLPGFNDGGARIVQLPPGRGKVNLAKLVVPPNVWLRGHGKTATILVRDGGTGLTDPVIEVADGSVLQTISDLGIINNDTIADCVSLAGSNSVPSMLADGHVTIENVVCEGGRDGIVAPDGTEHRFINVRCDRQYRHGFNITATDCFFNLCTSSNAGQANAAGDVLTACGFSVAGANTRMGLCKAFGQKGTSGGGFAISGSGRHQIGVLEAQDCQGDGFSLAGGGPCAFVALTADSCGGIGFKMDSPHALVGCVAVNRGGAYTLAAALAIPTYALGAQVRGMVTSGVRRIHMEGGAYTDSAYSGVDIDNCNGIQSAAFAATVTPDPWAGGTIYVGSLTGGITLANPSSSLELASRWPVGMRLTFWLVQDATGGRTVSFGAQYKTASAISTTASSTTAITFAWDGTNWRETGRSVT